MKKSITLIFLSLTLTISGQDTTELSILKADSTWRKEIIKFPIAWAPKLKFEGFEELRFSAGWGEPESDELWSYVLAWNLKTDKPLSSDEISINIEYYFDGLMKPNHWAQSFPEPVVVLMKQEDQDMLYSGKMKVFDGFHTGKMITKNMLVQQRFCETSGRTILICRLSPQPLEHPIWRKLNTVTLKENVCE